MSESNQNDVLCNDKTITINEIDTDAINNQQTNILEGTLNATRCLIILMSFMSFFVLSLFLLMTDIAWVFDHEKLNKNEFTIICVISFGFAYLFNLIAIIIIISTFVIIYHHDNITTNKLKISIIEILIYFGIAFASFIFSAIFLILWYNTNNGLYYIINEIINIYLSHIVLIMLSGLKLVRELPKNDIV